MACKCKDCQARRTPAGLPGSEASWRSGRIIRPADRLELYKRVARQAAADGVHPFMICKATGADIEDFNRGRLIAAERGETVEHPDAAPVPVPADDEAPEKESRWTDERRQEQADRLAAVRAKGGYSPRRPKSEIIAEKRASLMRYVEKMRKVGFLVYLPGEVPPISDAVAVTTGNMMGDMERAMFGDAATTVSDNTAAEDEAEGQEGEAEEEEMVTVQAERVRVFILDGTAAEVSQLLERWIAS